MRIAALTSGRQDWGILRSTAMRLRDDHRFDLRLLVGGMHCEPVFGRTEDEIRADGFEIAERLPWVGESDGPAGEAGRALTMVATALERQRPDALLLVGDRFETAAAAIAATLAAVPIVHLHGGEETRGAIDDNLRHAITKLSHLHLVSHPEHAGRVADLGEAADTIHVVGAPGLDNLHRNDLPDRTELELGLGIELRTPVVIVTVHPTTLRTAGGSEVDAVLTAMDAVGATYVVTLPNDDPGHAPIRQALRAAADAPGRVAVEALGARRFWGLLRIADAMLGNSSSALIEAAAVAVPAVNVGDRQLGRRRGQNILDAPATAEAVTDALRTALDPETRSRLVGTASPFGDGHAAQRIVEILATWAPPTPPRKAPIRPQRAPTPPSAPAADLIMIGGGEHASVVVDAAVSSGAWKVVGYVDPRPSATMDALGVRWLGDDAAAVEDVRGRTCILGVGGFGHPGRREAIIARYADLDVEWATVVHGTAIVAVSASIGPGAAILARTVVNPGARVGPQVIVNTGAIVEHDVEIGAGAHVGPGAVIGGGAVIGPGASIGLGARVRDHVVVGSGAIIGMGAVVVDDVEAGSTVVGVPAHPLLVPAASAPESGRPMP